MEEQFPLHVVCDWLGNSQSVAAKHYLQTTDAHFEKALDCFGLDKANPGSSPKSDAAPSGDPKQNPKQQIAESGGGEEQAEITDTVKHGVFPLGSILDTPAQVGMIAAEGLEPPTRGL